MIISHKHKFIYLKTVKTASTSIEVALSKYCGADDLVTAIYPSVAGHHAQNNSINMESHSNIKNLQVAINSQARPYSDYYICFNTRNPWDRAVSYYYHYERDIGCSFRDWVITNYKCLTIDEPNRRLPHLKHWYQYNQLSNIINGYVRYEYLLCDYNKLLQSIGINKIYDYMPRCKINNCRDRNYKSYYDYLTSSLIEEGHAEELELFSYYNYKPSFYF